MQAPGQLEHDPIIAATLANSVPVTLLERDAKENKKKNPRHLGRFAIYVIKRRKLFISSVRDKNLFVMYTRSNRFYILFPGRKGGFCITTKFNHIRNEIEETSDDAGQKSESASLPAAK